MTTHYSKPAVLSGSSRWPHHVVNFWDCLDPASLAPEAEAKAVRKARLGAKVLRAAFDGVIKDVEKIHRVLALVGRYETAVVFNFFSDLPQVADTLSVAWKLIRDTPRLQWILVARNPESAMKMLPDDWGVTGYSNVCVAAVLENAEDLNRERLAALRQIPTMYRGIWIDIRSVLTGISDWNAEISWVIADNTDQASSSHKPEQLINWVNDWRKLCDNHGIALYLNDPKARGVSSALGDGARSKEQPFSQDIYFHRPPLPGVQEDSRPPENSLTPNSVESALHDTHVAPPSIVSEAVDGSNGSVEETLNEVQKLCQGALDSALEPDAETRVALIKSSDHATARTTRARFEVLDAIARKGVKAFLDAGPALQEIRADDLWREGDYPSWAAYCTSVLGMSKSYANRIILCTEIRHELGRAKLPIGNDGNPILPMSEFQTRPLTRLKEPDQWLKAWKLSIKRATGMPAAATVIDVVGEIMAENSPPKPSSPSRTEQRLGLISQLCALAESAESWVLVREIAKRLEEIA